MIVEKKSFQIENYKLENGAEIPVTLGYETYGTLNADKSNAILVAHYFSASSHAAGKYSEDDAAPGYWDALIGPGKAVDTDKYFVISTDNLANVQFNNPTVITTGPRSINPKTGKIFGSSFPAFTFKDVAGIQHEFITKQLGIEKLYAVMGASAGGFISLNWAVEFPERMEKVIGVITNPQNPVMTSFSVLQHAMRAIALDPNWNGGDYETGNGPKEGLKMAIQMMNAGAFSPKFYEETYVRDSAEERPYADVFEATSYERKLDEAVSATFDSIDASHWYYTCRATMMHDLAHGNGSLEEALDKIKADLMLVSCTQDQLQPTVFNVEMVEMMEKIGKKVELVKITSDKGHMAGVLEGNLFAQNLKEFLA
ncbi:homoserine O-acetyltransferase [Listeria floridensis FSL S10-1187]|uniref:Probable acyltransferase n=2 Tax=Listeria floridensis TaxID=1494962 RepID=A0ABN0RID7_9LIST|nr:homoserine O-acetyltransferase [Listeria floridensis FSL S10-1187]